MWRGFCIACQGAGPQVPLAGADVYSATHAHFGQVWKTEMQQLGLGSTAPAQPGSMGEPAMS